MLPEVLWCILHEYKYTPEICGYICFSISLSFAKPPIFHIDKMTCCPVSCPVSCLFSITKFGFIFSELHILFLKSDVLFFFTNNNWTNSFSNVWYQWDASRPCVRSRPCPPSPKKAIRFGPSKICLVLLQSSPQESKFLLCKATRQKTRPGCFCAKDCLDSVEMYTWWYTFTCTGGGGL